MSAPWTASLTGSPVLFCSLPAEIAALSFSTRAGSATRSGVWSSGQRRISGRSVAVATVLPRLPQKLTSASEANMRGVFMAIVIGAAAIGAAQADGGERLAPRNWDPGNRAVLEHWLDDVAKRPAKERKVAAFDFDNT